MEKTYKFLFTEIAHGAEVSAERVIEINHEKGDVRGEQTATVMREDYAKLYDYLQNVPNDCTLTKDQFAKILVGAYIMKHQFEDRQAATEKAIRLYTVDLLPKLNRIINESENDEAANELANQLFKEPFNN